MQLNPRYKKYTHQCVALPTTCIRYSSTKAALTVVITIAILMTCRAKLGENITISTSQRKLRAKYSNKREGSIIPALTIWFIRRRAASCPKTSGKLSYYETTNCQAETNTSKITIAAWSPQNWPTKSEHKISSFILRLSNIRWVGWRTVSSIATLRNSRPVISLFENLSGRRRKMGHLCLLIFHCTLNLWGWIKPIKDVLLTML